MKNYLLLCLLIFPSFLLAGDDHHHHHDDEFEQHAAHVHGYATANISYEENELNIQFTFPAIDIYGFEHEAKNEEEKQKINNAQALLNNSENIITLKPMCEVASHEAHDDHHHDHSEHHEHHDHADDHSESEHSDVELEYLFKCTSNSKIEIDFVLFNSFPSLKELQVQFISNNMQQLFTVTPTNSSISIH